MGKKHGNHSAGTTVLGKTLSLITHPVEVKK